MKLKIGEFATVASGSTPLRSKYKEFFSGGNVPWVKTMDLTNGPIITTDEKITSLAASTCRPFPKDTVLVAMYGGFNQIGRTGLLIDAAAVNQAISAIVVDKNICQPEYLLQYLNHNRNRWKQYAASSRKDPNITRADVVAFQVILPPLPEQKAIADLLSTWDAAIEKTERLIGAKEKQLRLDSNWMLFGHRRVCHRETKLVRGQFFRHPTDWQLVKINSIAKEVSLRNANSNERVLSCSKYDGFVNSLDYFGKQVFSSDTSNYKVIKKGQFGFPSNHIEEGSIGLLEHCEEGIVSPIYIVFKVDEQKVYSQYLYRLFKTNIFQHIFQINTSSSVDRRGSLRWIEFSKIVVPLPKLDEQKEIADNLSVIQKEINLLIQLREKYKLQKRGLMQKLLTGEWRVKPEIVDRYGKDGI